MKKQYFLIGIFLFICQFAKAQSHFEPLEFKAFSELVAQPERFNSLGNSEETVFSVGYGVGVDLKYSIGQKFYLKAGSNLINRRFKSRVTFNQAGLFPEGTPVHDIFLSTKNLSYQILELHTGFGYNFLENDKMTYSAYTEIGGYNVISANYNLGTSLYEDKHKKMDVFGLSVLVGMQAKIRVNDNWTGLIGVETSIVNKIGKDKLLQGKFVENGNSRDRNGSNVPHNFYRLSLGIQKQF